MSEQPDRQSAVERAEHVVDNAEQSIKSFFTRAGQSLQQSATSLQEKTSQAIHSTAAAAETPASSSQPNNGQAAQPASERAEKLVEEAGQRVSAWTSTSSSYIQRWGALLRENAEDFWAEAQNIRRSRAH